MGHKTPAMLTLNCWSSIKIYCFCSLRDVRKGRDYSFAHLGAVSAYSVVPLQPFHASFKSTLAFSLKASERLPNDVAP